MEACEFCSEQPGNRKPSSNRAAAPKNNIYMYNYESGPYLSCKSVTSAGAGDLKSENRPALLAPEGRRSRELLPPGTIQLCTLIF